MASAATASSRWCGLVGPAIGGETHGCFQPHGTGNRRNRPAAGQGDTLDGLDDGTVAVEEYRPVLLVDSPVDLRALRGAFAPGAGDQPPGQRAPRDAAHALVAVQHHTLRFLLLVV